MATTAKHERALSTIRRLGCNEAYQLAVYLLDKYRGTSVCCHYEMPLDLAGAQNWKKHQGIANDAILRTILKHGHFAYV
ncbi:hypothetical protein GGR51DRAFT_560882 [Nemania sp. FL0031]|nr:hypothetical protein GGR51DRAFT_560882 [Nemania sp. FL0031]